MALRTRKASKKSAFKSPVTIISIPRGSEPIKEAVKSSRNLDMDMESGLYAAHNRKDVDFLHWTSRQNCWELASVIVDKLSMIDALNEFLM